MPDIIQLLPDAVANQIAAGEVIQRPASVIKELVENSVDAGSTHIEVIVKDAGKTLIQVIDNGKGMSETDARLSFERHATSKIKSADDLFSIHSMGFRGEALASIAAIAYVELKTRRNEDSLGTKIEVQGSKVVMQESCQCNEGTSFSVKNLFYNVPARRKFLKADPVEFRHIIEEFQRIALSYPEVAFSLHHNNTEVFHFSKENIKQRIVSIMGGNYAQRMVPIEEKTTIIDVLGFIGKPEYAKKTRGEQYFFVNKRFFRHPYFQHAVQSAYEALIPQNEFASYFLYFTIDPKAIDINIHPTKTEIKFEDEKHIYAIIRSAVRQALGKHNLTPTLDFEREQTFDVSFSADKPIVAPTIKVNPDFNPFKTNTEKNTYANPNTIWPKIDTHNKENWQKLYEGHESEKQVSTETSPFGETKINQPLQTVISSDWDKEQQAGDEKVISQLHLKFILSPVKSGIMLIHQQYAHERILYERFRYALQSNKGASQRQLFPQTVEFNYTDADLIKELNTEIAALGFEIREFGKNSFIVDGLPADISASDPQQLLCGIIESYKNNLSVLKIDKREALAQTMAQYGSIKPGTKLNNEEMRSLIDQLFACETPYYTAGGKPTLSMMSMDDLEKRFISTNKR